MNSISIFYLIGYLCMIAFGILYAIKEYRSTYKYMGWITITMGFLIGVVSFVSICVLIYGVFVLPIQYIFGNLG